MLSIERAPKQKYNDACDVCPAPTVYKSKIYVAQENALEIHGNSFFAACVHGGGTRGRGGIESRVLGRFPPFRCQLSWGSMDRMMVYS